MTKGVFEEGEYLASDTFGVAFEIFGSSPIYLIAGLVVVICIMCVWRLLKLRPAREIICLLLCVAAIYAFTLFFTDMFEYIMEHAGVEEDSYLWSALDLVAVISAIPLTVLVIFAMRNLNEDTLRSLIKFVIAFIIMAAIANLIVQFIKSPIGRMRYRAMNSELGQYLGGFDNYTAWYVMNGQNEEWVELFKNMYGVSDAFKSFPSGHTCAAGMTYALILLPDILNIKKKPARAFCWIFPVVFTGIVAISRIVVGAHYFSDVLVGGTLAFLAMMLAREIIVFRFEHFKCFKKGYVENSVQLEEIIAE